MASLWRNLSHSQTRWTLKARNAGFFHLGGCHLDDFGKGTSRGFSHRESARFPNGITFWGTLTHTWVGGFGSNVRQGESCRGRLHDLVCLESLRLSRRRCRLPVCRLCRLFQQSLELFGTFAIVERHFVFACSRFHLQTESSGRMRHGFCEDLLSQVGPFLNQGGRHRINQPVLQDPNTPNTARGPPPLAREIRIQIDIEWNPFQQIF